jgi:tyrosyl-tRNA synthetase
MSATTARRPRCMSATDPIMMLRWLQQTGNKPIALMGGGTTAVGDPSGKDEMRASC